MKKSDLRTGMKVITAKNETEYIVMLNADRWNRNYLVSRDGWLDLDEYDENMRMDSSCSDWSIVKVFEESRSPSAIWHFYATGDERADYYILIWDREIETKMDALRAEIADLQNQLDELSKKVEDTDD